MGTRPPRILLLRAAPPSCAGAQPAKIVSWKDFVPPNLPENAALRLNETFEHLIAKHTPALG